jgi:hypothetical protein
LPTNRAACSRGSIDEPVHDQPFHPTSPIAAIVAIAALAAISAALWWQSSAELRLITEILCYLVLATMWKLLAGMPA